MRWGCVRGSRVQGAVLREHREELQSKGLVLPVPALAAVFLERAHDEHIYEVQRLLGHFIEGVAFDEKHIFVREVHMETKRDLFLKRAAGALTSGRLLGRFRLVNVSDRNPDFDSRTVENLLPKHPGAGQID